MAQLKAEMCHFETPLRVWRKQRTFHQKAFSCIRRETFFFFPDYVLRTMNFRYFNYQNETEVCPQNLFSMGKSWAPSFALDQRLVILQHSYNLIPLTSFWWIDKLAKRNLRSSAILQEWDTNWIPVDNNNPNRVIYKYRLDEATMESTDKITGISLHFLYRGSYFFAKRKNATTSWDVNWMYLCGVCCCRLLSYKKVTVIFCRRNMYQ